MELFQKAKNPWGQEILIRASWDWLWVVIGLAVLFLLIHFILRRRWIGKPAEPTPDVEGIPEKVERHSLAARLFHGVMAASMLVLLFTGFLPILGIHFNWLTIHWVTGFVLIGCVVFHIIHVLVRNSWLDIWVGPRDAIDWFRGMSRALGGKGPPPEKSGKYPVDNKLYHHAIVVTGLGVIVTGILMMKRIDNPILAQNNYLYEETTWGWIYIIHGFTAIGLVGLIIAHVYFAILPEKRWITYSMLYGWISRKNYLDHHDPKRWKNPKDAGSGPPERPAGEPAAREQS